MSNDRSSVQRLKHFKEQFAKVFGRLLLRLERSSRPGKSLRGDGLEMASVPPLK
jgi:hypothetical protein